MFGLLERTKQLTHLLNSTECSDLKGLVRLEKAFDTLYEWLYELKSKHQSVFVIGNGGSCGIASHHMVDLINVLGVRAISLSDNNLLTCMGNDYGYANIYSRPLEVFGAEGDLLIAISSSGASENILSACEVFRQRQGRILTLSGFEANNPLRRKGDLNIWTGQKDYGLVESAHFFILHTLVDGWKNFLEKHMEKQLARASS